MEGRGRVSRYTAEVPTKWVGDFEMSQATCADDV